MAFSGGATPITARTRAKTATKTIDGPRMPKRAMSAPRATDPTPVASMNTVMASDRTERGQCVSAMIDRARTPKP